MIAVLGVLIFTAAVCFIEMLRHRSRKGMWMRRCMQLRNRMAANEAAIIERTASEAIQIAESVVNHKDCMCEKCLTASLIQHEIRNRFPSTNPDAEHYLSPLAVAQIEKLMAMESRDRAAYVDRFNRYSRSGS